MRRYYNFADYLKHIRYYLLRLNFLTNYFYFYDKFFYKSSLQLSIISKPKFTFWQSLRVLPFKRYPKAFFHYFGSFVSLEFFIRIRTLYHGVLRTEYANKVRFVSLAKFLIFVGFSVALAYWCLIYYLFFTLMLILRLLLRFVTRSQISLFISRGNNMIFSLVRFVIDFVRFKYFFFSLLSCCNVLFYYCIRFLLFILSALVDFFLKACSFSYNKFKDFYVNKKF